MWADVRVCTLTLWNGSKSEEITPFFCSDINVTSSTTNRENEIGQNETGLCEDFKQPFSDGVARQAAEHLQGQTHISTHDELGYSSWNITTYLQLLSSLEIPLPPHSLRPAAGADPPSHDVAPVPTDLDLEALGSESRSRKLKPHSVG